MTPRAAFRELYCQASNPLRPLMVWLPEVRASRPMFRTFRARMMQLLHEVRHRFRSGPTQTHSLISRPRCSCCRRRGTIPFCPIPTIHISGLQEVRDDGMETGQGGSTHLMHACRSCRMCIPCFTWRSPPYTSCNAPVAAHARGSTFVMSVMSFLV